MKAEIERLARLMLAASIVREDEALPIEQLPVERTQVLSFANSHAANLACADAKFLDFLLNADVLYRDGIGMSLLFRWKGSSPGRNMNGTDVIPRVLAATCRRPVPIYGSSLEVADAAAQKLRREGVNVVSVRDGFQPIAEYANALSLDKPRVVVLGMGMPKQEEVSSHLRNADSDPVLIINRGAILDVLADRFPRAPVLIRRLGLEWLFRLFLEPGVCGGVTSWGMSFF